MTEIDYKMLQDDYTFEIQEDLHLAKLLQQQYEMEAKTEKPTNNLVYYPKTGKDPTKSLVDPSWEVVDPTPDIHHLFVLFDGKFFWNKLQSVCVSWSKRMTSCAGVCSYNSLGGLCRITLSEPLLKLRPRKDLVETLLHEMIHAFLFVTFNNKDRDGHGPEFHKHMFRINKEAGTNITVYHTFHDEVRLYQQHWWRCNGPCQHRKPYFGMVKRAMNRAPGPHDFWWNEHSRNCGGTFVKVKEPEKKLKKSEKNKENKSNTSILDYMNKNDKRTVSTNNIQGFHNLNKPKSVLFKSNSTNTLVITKTTTKSPILNDKKIKPKISDKIKQKDNTDYTMVRNHWSNKYPEIPKTLKRPSQTNDEIDKKLAKLSTASCPICLQNIPIDDLNGHLDDCLKMENEKMKECIICGKNVRKTDYETHVNDCLDNSKFSQENLEHCQICGEKFEKIDYNNHILNCSDHILNDVDFKNEKQCPLCEKSVINDIFDSHVEKCILKIYEEIEKTNDRNEEISCLACGKTIKKPQLDSHLNECMVDIFQDENFAKLEEPSCSKELSACPFCLKLIDDDLMKSHIDGCFDLIS